MAAWVKFGVMNVDSWTKIAVNRCSLENQNRRFLYSCHFLHSLKQCARKDSVMSPIKNCNSFFDFVPKGKKNLSSLATMPT